MDFASTISTLRRSMHLSQEKFGELVNVSQRTVAAWESGDRLPSIAVLDDLADRLNVTVDYLLGRETGIKKQPAITDDELREKALDRINRLSEPALIRVFDFLQGLETGQALGVASPADPGPTDPQSPEAAP